MKHIYKDDFEILSDSAMVKHLVMKKSNPLTLQEASEKMANLQQEYTQKFDKIKTASFDEKTLILKQLNAQLDDFEEAEKKYKENVFKEVYNTDEFEQTWFYHKILFLLKSLKTNPSLKKEYQECENKFKDLFVNYYFYTKENKIYADSILTCASMNIHDTSWKFEMGKVIKNYELKVNDEVIDVNVNGDDVTLNYENDNGILNVTYNLVDYTLSGNLSTNGYEYKFDITNTEGNGKNIVFDFNSESDGMSLVLDLTTTKISDTESNLVGSVEINSNDINLALDIEMNNRTGSDLVEEQTFNNAVNIDDLTTADQNEIENNLMSVLEEIVPGVMDNARMQQFLLTAQINASTASVATYPGSCITLEQLGSDVTVWGKVEVDSTGGYTISITDGTYMILNKYVSYGSELSESDVELYDQSRFTEQYYTCLVA